MLLPAAVLAGPTVLVRDGQLAGGATDAGLVLLEEGEARWTCLETLPAEGTFWWLDADGVVAGTELGVVRTADGGCSWESAWGPLASLGATGLAATDDALLVAADGLWRSTDGGASWQELVTSPPEPIPASVVADTQAERLRLVGVDAGGVRWVLGSDDGGDSWLTGMPMDAWADAQLLLMRPDGEAVYLAATSTIGDPFLLALDVDLTSSTQVLDLPGAPVVGAAMVGDDLLYVVVGLGLFRRPPGGDPTPVPGGPTGCLVEADGRLWGCGEGDALVRVSEDGAAWASELAWEAVVPRDCPPGTPGSELCPEAWAALQGDDDDSAGPEPQDDDDSGDGDQPADCNCTSAPGGGLGLVWVWVLAAAISRGSRPRRRCG